jgi:hypothetical protein
MLAAFMTPALAPAAPAAAGNGGPGDPVPASGWPGLEEQLQADHVAPSSALAKLIAENQDFGLLRPEEAADARRLPPWLRVLWRKHHPDGRYLASDPTGGYPRLLRDVHQSPGQFTVYPGDAELSQTSNLSFSPGQVRANNAVLQLAGDGGGTIYVDAVMTGTADLLLDVNGYFK